MFRDFAEQVSVRKTCIGFQKPNVANVFLQLPDVTRIVGHGSHQYRISVRSPDRIAGLCHTLSA